MEGSPHHPDNDLLNLLNFVSLLHPSTSAELESKSVTFGDITRHKTLILDLDETLIHSRPLLGEYVESKDKFVIEIGESKNIRFEVTMRPHIKKIVEELSQYYEIAVFTAAESEYANAIIDGIDPDKKLFDRNKLLHRSHCIARDTCLVKDLNII